MIKKLIYLLGVMVVIAVIGTILIQVLKPGRNSEDSTDRKSFKVVATFYPMYMIGENIADGAVDMEVKSLTNLDTGCLHDYQLTTQDMKLISEADVLVVNGGGIEAFMEDIRQNYPKLTIIDASTGITMSNDNPHIWLDPQLYIRQIENVRDGLIEYLTAEPDMEDIRNDLTEKITQNSAAYISEISVLDQELSGYIASMTEGGSTALPEAVIFHDAFAYLAERAGIPVAFTVPLDEDTSLSAGEIAEIIDRVRTGHIRFLFTEKQYSTSVAERIAAETEAVVYIIDSVVTGDGAKDSYQRAMKNNIAVIKEALQ